MTYQLLRRDLLPARLEAQGAQPLAEAAGYDEAFGRAMWAFAHGMASLEIDGRFPAACRPRPGLARRAGSIHTVIRRLRPTRARPTRPAETLPAMPDHQPVAGAFDGEPSTTESGPVDRVRLCA
jgi:hypothetical protein